MTVKVSKPAINVREELADLRKPTGVAGEAMLRAETPQEQFNLIGAGRRNLLINGDMRIAQAATSITTIGTGGYQACDRWRIQTNLNHTTHTWAQVADAPDGFKYSSKLTVGTGVTPSTGDFGRLYQRMEVQDAKHLQWGTSKPQPITLSFWVKASIAGKYGGVFSASATGVYVFAYNVNQADVWEYKTYTVTDGMTTFGAESADNGIGFGVCFDLGEGPSRSSQEGQNPTTSAGTMGLTGGVKILATSGATWQITGLQLEQNKFATPFEHARSYGEELALCQRYYYKIDMSASENILPVAAVWSSNVAYGQMPFPVEMRAVPSFVYPGGSNFIFYSAGSSAVVNYITSLGTTKNFWGVHYASANTNWTAGNAVYGRRQTTSAYLSFDAEL
jgi:hypothetical protein